MKFLCPFFFVLLAGCRTVTPTATLPQPVAPRAPAVASAAPMPATPRPAATVIDPRSRQQAQIVEALISQNEALAAQLAAFQTVAGSRDTVPHEPAPNPASPPALERSIVPLVDNIIEPNAEGLIDLTAIENAGAPNDTVNPFTVRTAPGDQPRDVSLKVGGIIQGATPCALVNERLVQKGDRIETFTVEEISTAAVIVRSGPHRLRLPVSPVPTRIRLPL